MLTSAVRSYIDTALWSSTADDDEDGDAYPMDEMYDIGDLAAETLDEMSRTVNGWIDTVQREIPEYYTEMSDEDIAHYLWLSQCGHGVGYWSLDTELGDKLQELMEREGYSERWLYVGDDRQVYIY